MRLFIFITFFCLSLFALHSQIGINTSNVSGTTSLIVASSKTDVNSSILRVKNSDNKEMFSIRGNGYASVGGGTPLVKLDLRSTLFDSNELGIGTTTKKASTVGAGAIRYETSKNALQYSDGTNWVTLETTPPKVYVLAINTSPQTLAPKLGYINNWTKISDENNCFTESSGAFKAPVSSIYSVTGVCKFTDIDITGSGAGYRSIELAYSTSSVAAYPLKSLAVIYADTGSGLSLQVVNKNFVYMNAGDVLSFRVWNGTPKSIKLSTVKGDNMIMISQL